MPSQIRTVLLEVAQHLLTIGSANDAEDHHYVESAEQMRADACASLGHLLEQNPCLDELLPGLRPELETGHILGFGWSDLLSEVERKSGTATGQS